MGDQPKVFEYAKTIGLEPLALMDKIRGWKLPVKSHMAALSFEIISEIENRLEQESTPGPKVKKTKKKAVKKKATSKTSKKTTKKTATKKTVVTKTITKKTSKSKSSTTEEPTAEVKKTVIRRRATTPKTQEIEAQKSMAMTHGGGPQSPAEGAQAGEKMQTQTAALNKTTEATDPQSQLQDTSHPTLPDSPTKASEESTKLRGNIVGRIDLKRTPTSKPSSPPSTPKSTATAPRNIRTGFTSMPLPHVLETGAAKPAEKPARKKPGPASAGKEQPVQTFTATEFRKREVIFQPKRKRQGIKDGKKTQITIPKESKRRIQIYNTIKVSELAQRMGLKAPLLIKKLISEEIIAQIHTELDFDTVSLIATEFGFEAENLHTGIQDKVKSLAFGDLDAKLVSRPPVVTVMGHVDHGKTTLLDAIRSADVVSGEAGGITQHIGAYRVTLEDGKVATFIDTPGHAAFTAMRARGANLTDIAIIVVAADDGVMPQTEEAISHAKAAKVPMIIAINKIDRPGANIEKIKQQLMEYELVPEEWGGSTLFAEVSALKKEGLDNLIEQIHLVAEMQEIKSNPHRSARGVVIESSLKKGRGNVATLLVQEGTLKVGDYIVAGLTSGRVRQMSNEIGKNLESAGPGVPTEISGLESTPNAGDPFDVCQSEEKAREVCEQRIEEAKIDTTPKSNISLEDLFSKVTAGDVQELNIILKSDVAGSNEAIKGMLGEITHDEVKVNIIHQGVGGISESDVLLANTSGGIIIGFNVRPDVTAQRKAKEKNVDIRTYSIIYELVDDVKKSLSGLLRPDIIEKSQGQAEVREIFNIPRLGVIAGCSIIEGKVSRSCQLRLVRDGRVIYEGELGSLKRFKEDVKEVAQGYECGMSITAYNDLKAGDIIEAFTKEEVARTLE